MSRALLAAWLFAVAAHAEPPNLREAAAGVYVGGTPESEADWRSLAELGVQTVVGVDGLPPDAAAARSHGMRAVHVPIGYGGVPAEAALQLAQVATQAERPLYVYCHHGRHRGPAAAAIVCRASGLMDRAAARRLLESAGTDPRYAGLWRDVDGFKPPPPPPGAPAPPLREASPVPPLRLAMSELDKAWDRTTAAAEPEARLGALVLAAEAMKESRRAAVAAEVDDAMLKRFDESVSEIESLKNAESAAAFARQAAAVSAACVRCHDRYRDHVD